MTFDELFKAEPPVIPKRGVHLDLKGVPPTSGRLLELLKVFAAARYNVILVEWEDSFPWTVDERFRSPTAYTPDEVRRFQAEAGGLGMEIIPLVQCLGHMETPLSLPGYEHLRERPNDTSELNPTAEGSSELVRKMVDDVLALLPDVKHFHLGGDEAAHMGTHPDSRAFIEKHGKGALYMHHVEPVLDHLSAKGVRPILWHDMMIDWDGKALGKLAGKSDLLTWGYHEHPDVAPHHYNTKYIRRFHEHGFTLWGGTLYKSGSGQSGDLPDIEKCTGNSLAWVEVAQRFGYAGIIVTAWSRYSTDRVQCVPIDAALDCLVNVGAILHDGRPPAGGIGACAAVLAELGEKERFEACRAAMEKLTTVRRKGWEDVQLLREQIVLCRLDKRRGGSGMTQFSAKRLGRTIEQAGAVAEEVRKAFAGLIEPVWIEEYLNTRLMPLQDELDSVKGKLGVAASGE